MGLRITLSPPTLIKDCSLNHIGTLSMILRTLLNEEVWKIMQDSVSKIFPVESVPRSDEN